MFCVVLLGAMSSRAEAQAPDTPSPATSSEMQAAPQSTLVIATHEAPPFAFKGPDGQWQGISIDLWRQIADAMRLQYRLEPTDLPGMIDGVTDGRYAASVAATTITAERESRIDFTQPFYSTGFGIAVHGGGANWAGVVRSLFSWSFAQAVLALSIVILLIGGLTWAFERRRNPDFGGPWWRGLASGFWFSAVTMTTVGYGDKTPRTAGGRLVALVWMFTAIIVISTFTGMIASALTASQIEGKVRGPADLATVRVGSIAHSASEGWLTERRVGFEPFPDIAKGLDALQNRSIDAFVYDRPLLQYLINKRSGDDVTLLPGSFGRQDYGIALPQGSPLREPMNRALLRLLQSRQWTGILFRYLGPEGGSTSSSAAK